MAYCLIALANYYLIALENSNPLNHPNSALCTKKELKNFSSKEFC